MKRITLVGVMLALVASACGGSSSETEYVEGLNAMVISVGSQFEASYAAYDQIEDPTLPDLVARIERELELEYGVRETFETLDPPDSISDVHGIMVGTLNRLIAAAEALVGVADTVGSREELEATREFAEYQAINAESDSQCPEVQGRFDELSNSVVDAPWIGNLRLSVDALLDCD